MESETGRGGASLQHDESTLADPTFCQFSGSARHCDSMRFFVVAQEWRNLPEYWRASQGPLLKVRLSSRHHKFGRSQVAENYRLK